MIALEGFVPFLFVAVAIVLRARRPVYAGNVTLIGAFSFPDIGLTAHHADFAILFMF
nr:MAG TPA: hypothetical protein [Caudoviricetes sp.]